MMAGGENRVARSSDFLAVLATRSLSNNSEMPGATHQRLLCAKALWFTVIFAIYSIKR
jgi:hypothetical protein